MGKFKVDDKVVGARATLFHRLGEEGVISGIAENNGYWVVWGTDGKKRWVGEDEIELKEEPKTAFKVGDRVVTYEPVIVCDAYAGIVARVEEVFKDNIHIKYPDGDIQICYPEDDNLQHAPEMEMPVADKKPIVSNVEHYGVKVSRIIKTLEVCCEEFDKVFINGIEYVKSD